MKEAPTSKGNLSGGRHAEKHRTESLFRPTLSLLVIHALMPTGLALFLVFRVPEFSEILDEIGFEFSGFSATVTALSELAREHVSVLPVLVGVFLAGDALSYCLLRRFAGRIWAKLWWGLVFLVEAAALAGIALAVIVPYTQFRQTMGE